jgi:branched-chain amino acid transport system substrate-binding protein
MKKVTIFFVCMTMILAVGSMKVSAAEPIRIGVITIFSGAGAFVGAAQKNTLQMMGEEVNKSGGINGRPVEFIFYDDEMKPDQAVRLAKRLIQKDKVDVLLGPTASWTALPVVPIIEKFKVPNIMLASASALTNPVRKWVFKVPPGDKIVISRLFSYMQSQGINRLAVVSSQDGFGDGGRREILAQSSEYGIKIVLDERYTMEDSDITPTLGKVKKTDAQAVVNWSSARGPIIMTMNYHQLGIKLPLYHSHGALSKSFLKSVGDKAEGAKLVGIKFEGAEGLPDSDPQKKVLLNYQAAYKSRFDKPANQFGGGAYDAFSMMTAALKKAGTDKAKVRDAIEQTSGFVGINGIFTYGPNDHGGISKETLAIYRNVNGQWTVIE